MFRSILKQCFGINYSMPLNRGHRIANTEALLRLSATEALLRYRSNASVVLLNQPINTTYVCYMLSQFRLSVVCLSVTLVHPTQAVEIFGVR